MRRGHSGIGGWRNDNPRQYRSRNGGNSHFRPSRTYSHVDPPRFPPPNSRSIGPLYNTHSENHDHRRLDHSERNRYRHNRQNRHNEYQRPHSHGPRQILPLLHQIRNSNDNQRNSFQVDNIHINSMGDVDHRQLPQLGNNYRQPFVNTWPSEGSMQQSNDRSQGRLHGSDDEVTKMTSHYTGHRPPASDHYGLNPTRSFDNSHSFSRSVDDTVDIVRRRLLNRNEPQQPTGSYNDNKNTTNIEQQLLSERVDNAPNNQQEQPAKKRFQRQKHNEKSATIKNKIVHQLFKMDKEKIHKLMDNPNSSHKFEYAISSLITESQNSFNRHLRSTAEKSLCSTGAEFMQNDNNTIYEDTFLKQMQCILDPQDTVFLEDLKPIVMAELSKVLQIDEVEQRFSASDNENTFAQQDDPNSYNEYPNNEYGYDNYPQNTAYSNDLSQTEYNRPQSSDNITGDYGIYEDLKPECNEPKPLFERRQRSKSYNYNEEINPAKDKDFYNRPSIDNEPVEDSRGIGDDLLQTSQQYFDTNAEQLSEDDDPFAELDQQYHVAVDHDFIKNDDITIPSYIKDENSTNSINIKTEFNVNLKTPDKNSKTMIDEINNQLKDMAKSPLKLSYSCLPQERKENNFQLINECNLDTNIIKQEKDEGKIGCIHDEKTNTNNSKESQDMTKDHEKIDNPLTELKSFTPSNSRKRSIEQRPPHRKEKRKKVETSQVEAGKQILNKNIIINVNDCASKATEKCDAPKSIFNLFFSKEESKSISKDNKRVSPNDKNYTDKHVRRKESPKKTNDTKKRKESTSSQSTSPYDSNQTTTKSDSKTSLKSIDMFTEQPKKNILHQAHRNTMPYKCDESDDKISEPKISTIKTIKTYKPFSRKIVKRHVAVQVIKKLPSKQTQTERKKFVNKAVQTDIPDTPATTSSDTFERMKQIDLEIQVLLQEKFKLYNSLESKSSGVICIESKQSGTNTLGMTLLNVSPNEFDEESQEVQSMFSEDAIVEDFTNIPVEDLEQIALESVEQVKSPKNEQRSRSRKLSRQDSIQSCNSTTVGKRKTKKLKSPNISLIEQIITDDRPLEDIISLDDFELVPKTKAKPQRKQAIKKKGTNKGNKVKPDPSLKIKDCSVVLLRQDISHYLKQKPHAEYHVTDNPKVKHCALDTCNEVVIVTGSQSIDEIHHDETVFEETIVNDIQIDMLDVSEDIVVGDCEVKYVEDKAVESVSVPISEEIILDNSQSSLEDATPASNQGEECKVYDYSADDNLRRDSIVVTGNGDAVLAIECVETNFLAACLDGNVYYFNNEGQLITTLRGSNLAVTCLTIVKEKYGTTVYTGSLDSRIRYYDLETGLEKGPECNVLSPIQTMDRAWDTVFVGTRTGFVLQFECKNNMLIPVSSVKFSDQSILALRAMKEGPRKVLLVAARSENVTIKDAQTGLLLRTLDGPKMTVYTLLYEDGKVYCGTSSHQIHVFDYTSGSHVGTHEGGKGAVCLRATGGLLFAGCYDGCVYVYREGEGQPFAQIRGPSLMLLSLAVVGSKIIAGYKDRSLYIWKIPLCILQEMIL